MTAELAVAFLGKDGSDTDGVERALHGAGHPIAFRRIRSFAEFEALLSHSPPDLVLCDASAPEVNPFEALQALKSADLQVPFFLVSSDAQPAAEFFELFRQGARGLVRKDRLDQLAPVVEQELAAARARGARRAEQIRAEEKLRKSERLFKALIEHSYEGVMLLDRDLKIRLAGPSILGYAEEQFIGRDPFDLIHPEDREAVRRTFHNLVPAPGATVKLEYRVRNAEGLWSWIESISRNFLDDPDVEGIIVNYRDVTTRKAYDEGLRDRAELLDLAQDAILYLRLDGMIDLWNRGAEQLYGWSAREALGRISHQLLQTRFPEPLPEIHRRLLNSGGWQGELEHTAKDGSKIVVASRWALRRDAGGRPVGFLEINRDVTERKQLEEKLRHTQKLESLGVLAGGVAHDFNNLLTGIMGHASLLLDSLPEDDPKRPWAANVLEGAEKAANLTRQLLAYAGKGKYVIEPVNLSALIEEIANLLRTTIPKHVELRLDLDRNVPLIEADVAQINQVIMNLVINGAEAVPEGAPGMVLVPSRSFTVDAGSVRPSFAGESIPPGLYAAMEVRDNGSGMTPEIQARIFDPFFTTKFTGRGLGLSAVSGIIRGHRGMIKIDSSPGEGTTFKLLFPAAQGAVRPRELRPSLPARASSGVILVVDDEEVVLRTATAVLQEAGYRVLAARHGREALDLLSDRHPPPNAIVLDMTMPVMSGDATLRELQAREPGIPVILSSGYSEAEAVEKFAGRGLAGFLQKPYTARGLIEAVQHALAAVSH